MQCVSVKESSFTVYTSSSCFQCKFLKEALERKGIPFEEVNITEDDGAREYLLDKGLQTVPVLMDFDELVFTGFRPERVEEMCL